MPTQAQAQARCLLNALQQIKSLSYIYKELSESSLHRCRYIFRGYLLTIRCSKQHIMSTHTCEHIDLYLSSKKSRERKQKKSRSLARSSYNRFWNT